MDNPMERIAVEEFSSILRKGKFNLSETATALAHSESFRREAVFVIKDLAAEIEHLKYELTVTKTAAEIVASAIRHAK